MDTPPLQGYQMAPLFLNPRSDPDAYPEKTAPTGPIWRTLVDRASPSMSGGGLVSLSRLTSLQVRRVGMQARPGGTVIRTPE